MKRFIKHWLHEWRSQDTIEKKDLIDIKDGFSDSLIDTVEGKYYDSKENSWKDIK